MRYADVEAGYNSQYVNRQVMAEVTVLNTYGFVFRYLIAVFNKRTHAVVLRPAKIHIISRHVKGLECLSTATQFTNTTLASMRKELSLAFGNAKQAKAVRDKEQRAIGAGAVGSTIKALQQGIQTAATSLPSRGMATYLSTQSHSLMISQRRSTSLPAPTDQYPNSTNPRQKLKRFIRSMTLYLRQSWSPSTLTVCSMVPCTASPQKPVPHIPKVFGIVRLGDWTNNSCELSACF